MTTLKKVCVVGAGVSGLRAAHKLITSKGSKLSASDVIIVEAQSRVGGRIKTDKSSSKLGLTYDLGAAWFHDALTNSVLHSSIKDGSFDVKSDGYFNDKNACYYAQEYPGKIDSAGLKLERVVEDIEKFIEIHYSSSIDAPDMSLTEIVKLYMTKYDQLLTSTQKQLCGRMCRYLELWYGISAEDISGKYAIMSHQGRNLYNKKGYSYLIDKLLGQAKCEVLTSEQVESITRDISNKPYKHLVTTNSGLEIEAQYLVITVPQSILALEAGHPYGITWSPPLPKSIQESLEKVHFGALGKVILEFEDIWWDASEDGFEVLPDEAVESSEKVFESNLTVGINKDEESGNSESPDGSPIVPFQYPIYVVNYATIQPSAASLVILTQSPVTEYLEKNPQLAWEYMKPMLSKISIKPLSNPINTIVTDWTQNPYARGSYSALHVGDDPSDIIIQLSGEYDSCGLGSGSTIRFAGEHTIADGAGCVHGAYDSGERAANWILEHLKGESG